MIRAACCASAPDGDLQDPGTWNALPQTREVNFEAAFPFVVNPPSIDATPIFTRADIELGRCPEPKVRKAEEPMPKVHKAENSDPPERASRKSRARSMYARPRRQTYPRYQPSSPGFSIGIGIGIGGGGGAAAVAETTSERRPATYCVDWRITRCTKASLVAATSGMTNG